MVRHVVSDGRIYEFAGVLRAVGVWTGLGRAGLGKARQGCASRVGGAGAGRVLGSGLGKTG